MKNKSAILFIILIAAVLYGLTLRGLAGNPLPSNNFAGNMDLNGNAKNAAAFELSPERGRFVHVIALGENGTYALNQTLADVAYPDVGYHGKNYFSFFQPGIAYMALPFYLLGRSFNLSQVASFASISLFSILALIFLYKIAREILSLPLWAALASVLIFAFGSTAWSYAITLYQHHVTVFLMLSGFYAVWRFGKDEKFGWLWAAWAGLAYALSVTVDSPNAILFMPVGLYLLICAVKVIREKSGQTTLSLRLGIFAGILGFCAGISLLLYFNQHYLGSWHTLNGSLPGYEKSVPKSAVATTTPVILDAAKIIAPPAKNIVGFFKQDNIPKGFVVLLFSRDRGLFFFAPIFLLALLGIYYALKRRANLEITILLALFGVNVFLYSSWGDPWGGWAYGPRYLIPSMSVLSLFVGVSLAHHAKNWWFRSIAFLLFAYSTAIALLGAITTNANPAKNEALALHTGYNFTRNWEFLKKDISGSFAYNSFFGKFISLEGYFFILLTVLLALAATLFFIMNSDET